MASIRWWKVFQEMLCHFLAVGLMLKIHYTFSAYIILKFSLY